MSEKPGTGTRAAATIAAFAAAFGVRKLLTLSWRRVTGKEPPADPHDPQHSIGEALGWAVLSGVAIESARLLAVRMATRQARQAAGKK
jgi:Protein of unknown function (DUF4235)